MFILKIIIFAVLFISYKQLANADIAQPLSQPHVIDPISSVANTISPPVQLPPQNLARPPITISTVTPDQVHALNAHYDSTAPNPIIPNTTPTTLPQTAIPPPPLQPINPAQSVQPATVLPQQQLPLTNNINNAKYHKPNIGNSNFTIIGSEGIIQNPEPLKEIEPPLLPTVITPVITVNTYKIIDRKQRDAIVEVMSEKQKAAQKENLPENLLKMSNILGWQRQVMPPNISQKVYLNSNKHLSPVIFQTDLDSTAFKYTINSNDVNLLRSLLTKITNVDIQDQYGNTLLIYSIYYFNYDAITLLLHNGANPNLYNDAGFGPLHLAASLGDDKAISLLLRYGAAVNVIDDTGSTPIMYACGTLTSSKVIKDLLYFGSNINIVNKNGMNIVDFAKSNQNQNILKYLEEKVIQ